MTGILVNADVGGNVPSGTVVIDFAVIGGRAEDWTMAEPGLDRVALWLTLASDVAVTRAGNVAKDWTALVA